MAPTACGDRLPAVTLAPLRALLDDVALIEHSVLAVPDPTSGHCTDDAGRALALACTMPNDAEARPVAERCLGFLCEMHVRGGKFRLRDRPPGGGAATSDDASGRAIHGIGIAAALAPWSAVSTSARHLFADVVDFDTPHVRARAHAVLGAAAVTAAGGRPPPGTRELVDRLVVGLDVALAGDWPWPEPRLSYGNAILVEARLAAASLRDDARAIERALRVLRWLVGIETMPGHFSPTPVGGWGPGEPRPGFDQQPIEAWTLADAALRAFEITGDTSWATTVHSAAGWFAGSNDTGVMMWDPSTGRAYDGLQRHGVNRNEGAESALALVGTLRAVERVDASVAAVGTSSRIRPQAGQRGAPADG
jgi:hypothetical protein